MLLRWSVLAATVAGLAATGSGREIGGHGDRDGGQCRGCCGARPVERWWIGAAGLAVRLDAVVAVTEGLFFRPCSSLFCLFLFLFYSLNSHFIY
ncbi:hypothetical protein SESBI_49931 [Sesbania bispinosa]|nr:hypothetical protein SESBI_49931 [Sesbania bispinosa]